jgi:hypothetical protein
MANIVGEFENSENISKRLGTTQAESLLRDKIKLPIECNVIGT